MSVGTLFTLFVTPAVYTLVARDHRAVAERERAAAAKDHADDGKIAQAAAAE